jgi:hypothetical protein
MTLLSKIVELKDNLLELEKDAEKLPEEIRHAVLDSFKGCRENLNTAGNSIEQFYKEDEQILNIKKDLLDKMDKEKIYKGVPGEKRQEMVSKIIKGSKTIFIKEKELKDFILKSLKALSEEDLIKKAYSKEEILNMGKKLLGKEARTAAEFVKYNKGLEFFVDSLAKFSNRQDTLDLALEKIMDTPQLCTNYLYTYYGV